MNNVYIAVKRLSVKSDRPLDASQH